MIGSDFAFLGALGGATDRRTMIDCLSLRLAEFGIGGFGYGFFDMRTSRGLDADLQDLHFHHTYPKEWESVSGTEDPLANDPATMLLLGGRRHVDWTEAGAAAPGFGPEAQRAHQGQLDLGMRFGATMQLGADRSGRLLSGMCVWFSDRPDHDAFHADWVRFGADIRRSLHLFDALARGDKAPTMIGLSARERDALSYLAAGYRSAEASWKMRISEKTFEKHVANAKEKLKAHTRDNAVAKALVLRLIDP